MTTRRLALTLLFAVALSFALSVTTHEIHPAQAVSLDLVISQVYGGGGNTGAHYQNDFVEIFNRGTTPISLAGWSIQYASATGTGNFGANSSQLTELPAVSLTPGQYLLIQAAGGATGAPLPTADVIDPSPIALSASAGKVALVNTVTPLGCNGSSTPCSSTQLAQIIDLVGYGNANFFEGSGAVPTLSNTTAALRAANGCTETDHNNADFSVDVPSPRNTASPLSPCLGGDAAPSVTHTTPADGATGVLVGSNIALDFSESVDVATGAITVECPAGNIVASNGAADNVTSVLIDPGSDLPPLTSCVIHIDAAGVTDEDTDDPPDNLTGQNSFSFTTEGPVCEQPFTPIYNIQGSGPAAAITGTVTTRGVVVGDYETSIGLQGFYLQDELGDADVATSDGIFVFTGSADTVSAGQIVRVTGFARERFNQTALNGANSNTSPVTNIVDCGSTGSVLPVEVTLPFASLDFLERFEGMLVRLPQALVISEYFNYERFGEIVLALPLEGETRAFTPTAIDEPGAPALARALANSLRRITLDDGLGLQNPDFLRHPNGSAFALDNRFRGGDTVQNVVGVLGFDFNLYRIQPIGPADYTAVDPRPDAPEPVGGYLRIAAMNTLNFFLTLDYPTGDPLDNHCGPLQNVECRGADADQPAEFTRQRTKLLDALARLDADILGLNEVENTLGVDPLGDPVNGIVAGLNTLLGADTYAHIDTGVIGTDAIRVGLIYRPARVIPIGDFKLLTTAVDPRFLDTKNRPALAQTFEDLATGARFTVVVNHLKSKGTDCDDVGDPDLGDGQGNCNLTRQAAAQALVDWLATDPTGSGDPDFLIMGDLNSYAREDPIDAIQVGADDTIGTGDDYTNLIAHYQGAHAYSYVFDGQAGYLDHVLASLSLAAQVTGAADWHINADEPDLLDYDTTFKPPAQEAIYEANAYRSSDHDPVVVGLNLDPNPLCQGLTATILGTPDDDVIYGTNGPDVIVGLGGNDIIYGGSGDDVICGNADDDILNGGSGNDTLDGGYGNDTLNGGNGNDTLIDNEGNDVLKGGNGNDTLTSGLGRDKLYGQNGNDVLEGGSEDDVLSGGNDADTLDGGSGADSVSGNNGDDRLSGADGNDTLIGGNGNDVLDGGADADVLVGNSGRDTLTGGTGADSFSGGPGADVNTDFNPVEGDTSDGT